MCKERAPIYAPVRKVKSITIDGKKSRGRPKK